MVDMLQTPARGKLGPAFGHLDDIVVGARRRRVGADGSPTAPHGLQFKAAFLKTSSPTLLEGIEKHLDSGMIRGIGLVHATKLVRAFGVAVFECAHRCGLGGPEGDPRDHAVPARGRHRRQRAVRIYKTYGTGAVQMISGNPYRLARDIRGIGFLTADRVAEKFGIERTATIRVRAGIWFALVKTMDEGHRGLPVDELTVLVDKLIEVSPLLIAKASSAYDIG